MEEDLIQRNFDANKFIAKRWKPGGGDDVRKLRELRAQIQSLADESAQVVKKNVFQNYTQFIETAKEISHLESDMYQLSHYLTEQKSLIDSMMELSLTGVKDKTSDPNFPTSGKNTGGNVLQHLLEKVENCSHLSENLNREILLESDLTELNFETFMPIRQVHAFLLTDGFMLTSILPHSLGGGARYRFETLYQLENLALINVKEEGSISTNNIFKLLVFPEHKLFQCENARVKKKWMDTVDNAKKRMIREGSLMRQATIRLKKEKEANNQNAQTTTAVVENKQITEENLAAEIEYLRELPDELDACIVQRDFDNAVDILQEGREQLQECPDASFVREISDKLDRKQQQLVEVLCKDLKAGADKNMQGGPKAARKAMALLTKLGKSSQACDLYLKSRSAFIKHSIRELKIVDNPLHYAQQLTQIMCTNLVDVGREFLRFFNQNASCFSVLSLWASGELKNYVNLIVRHVFDSAPSLFVLGQCVRLAYTSFEQLANMGLDFSFELDKLLEPHLIQAIQENKRNYIEALKLRISEDKWRPYNMQSESNLKKFLDEVKEIGLNLENYVCSVSMNTLASKEKCFLWLTNQTCQFARNVIPFSRELAYLRLGLHVKLCDEALTSIWDVELSHLKNSEGKHNKEIFERNAKFTMNQLMNRCTTVYCQAAKINNKEWFGLSNLLTTKYPTLSRYRFEHGTDDIEEKYENIGDV